MGLIRQKRFYLISCLLIIVWLLVSQIFSNAVLLFGCLCAFITLSVLAVLNDMAIPLLFFFLPWAPILKFSPGTISLYTLALFAMLGICALRVIKNAYIYHLFPALLLIGYTLVVKAINHYPIVNNYITLVTFLVLFPFISKELRAKYDFYTLTVWLSLGVVLAALSAKWLMVFPGIARYVTVHDYLQYTVRLCGYYGDPNFYATHITTALAGIMVLLTKELLHAKRILLCVLMLFLLYCGFLSVSKSFILIVVCLMLFWVLHILFQKGDISIKMLLLFSIFIGVAFVLSSTVFNDLLEMVFQRFRTDGSSLDSMTTHRTEGWQNYINEMKSDLSLLLGGRGYTNVLVDGRASHNTVLQIVYQTGVLGVGLMLAWGVAYIHSMIVGVRIKYSMLMPVLILITGALGPWLGLDMLFFDEFFLLPLYIGSGIYYLSTCEQTSLKQND